MPQQSRGEQTADWLHPGLEQRGIQRYIATLRERKWLILLTVVVTTVAAAVYVATASKSYKATADVLITPVPSDDTTLAGLGLIRASSDPTRDVETAAGLITNRDVDDSVKSTLGVGHLDVTAVPVAQSNIVSVTATASSAALARDEANAVVHTAIQQRTAKFHRELANSISALRARTAGLSLGASTNGLRADLARLQSLTNSPDPTLRVDTLANTPTHQSWPKPKLSIVAGVVIGLILGIGGAFALQLLDPRARREEDVRRLFRLPVLARIPKERTGGRRGHGDALAPRQLSPSAVESFRTLRATLSAAQGDNPGSSSVLVTGPSPSEGKTTVSVNLAASLAMMGHEVILIEADLRRPGAGRALGATPGRHGIVSVLLETVPLKNALVTANGYEGRLRMLLVDQAGEWMADRLSLPAAKKLVAEAKQLADYVIIDSPPLTEVIDALPLAQRVDDVMLVVGLGKSHLGRLNELGELLAQHDIAPVGMVLVGVPRSRKESRYYRQAGEQRRLRPEDFGEVVEQPGARAAS